MRKKLISLLTVLGATTVLVLAANTVTYAATGHSFILGKVNKASTTTVLKRTTNGPALSLVTRPTAPPFTVTSAGKVANLNADLVDGLDSAALTGVRASVYRYAFTTKANVHSKTLPTLAPGVYLATFDVLMGGAGGTQAAPGAAYCEFDQSGAAHGVDEVTPSRLGWDPALTATTVLSTADGAISLSCSSANPWNTTASFPAEVTFTKLDGASIGPTIAGD